jgi:hypothetical protein
MHRFQMVIHALTKTFILHYTTLTVTGEYPMQDKKNWKPRDLHVDDIFYVNGTGVQVKIIDDATSMNPMCEVLAIGKGTGFRKIGDHCRINRKNLYPRHGNGKWQ